MSRVVAIANQKGGVGKTTTAVNLGASLAVAEQRVLLVDLDPQGNASTGVGCSPGDEDQEGSYELLLGEVDAADVIHETEMPYLHVISATQDLAAPSVICFKSMTAPRGCGMRSMRCATTTTSSWSIVRPHSAC